MLYRVIYRSQAHPSFGEDHLDALLAQCRRNNAAEGLTGALILHDHSFFQCIEGPKPAVLACFQRILGDWRHRDIVVARAGAAGRRVFGDWNMGSLTPEELPPTARKAMFALHDILPRDASRRADDAQVFRHVIDFLEGFEMQSGAM